MESIQELLNKLIDSISSDALDKDVIFKCWKQYCSMFPDLSRAMSRLQNEIISTLIKDNNNSDVIIKLGQMMENLRWSINNR